MARGTLDGWLALASHPSGGWVLFSYYFEMKPTSGEKSILVS
jgi:hypothetical protein